VAAEGLEREKIEEAGIVVTTEGGVVEEDEWGDVEVEPASEKREEVAGRLGGDTAPGELRPRAASIACSTSSGRWQG
jgi:hypothetical protein